MAKPLSVPQGFDSPSLHLSYSVNGRVNMSIALPGFSEEMSEVARNLVSNGVQVLSTSDKSILNINPDTLDISNSTQCVLGQLYGDFDRGRRVLGYTDSSVNYGFDTGYVDGNYIGADLLHAAWAEAIDGADNTALQVVYANRIAKDAVAIRVQRARNQDELDNVNATIEKLIKSRARLERAIANAVEKATALEALAPLVGAIEL